MMSSEANKMLLAAAQYGNYPGVDNALKKGVLMNVQDDNTGDTALFIAIKNGFINIAINLIEKGADYNIPDKSGHSPFSFAWAADDKFILNKILEKESIQYKEFLNHGELPIIFAAKNNHVDYFNSLIQPLSEDLASTLADNFGRTALICAAQNGNTNIISYLLEQGTDPDSLDSDGHSALFWAAQGKYWEIAVMLLNQGADIQCLSEVECDLLKQYVEASDDDNELQLLQFVEHRLLNASIGRLRELREQSTFLNLEAVVEATPCSHRREQELVSCMEEADRDNYLFPYEPLEESVLVEQRQAARLYSQLALAVAWQQGEPLGNLLRYQRYLGDILEEWAVNQSPRERQLVREHYQQALQFFRNYPKKKVLRVVSDHFEPLARDSLFLESGQHSLLVFKADRRYQLYSPSFNYRHRFQTRPSVSWSEMSAFIQAFFQWKTGFRNYQALVLQQPFADKVLAQLQAAPFWQPDNLAPDRVLLSREPTRLIEGIPVRVVRSLVRVNRQPVEVDALSDDFFQHTAMIRLRIENLHSILAELTEEERRAVVQAVNQYHWSDDTTLLQSLAKDERFLLADYQQRVMSELRIAETFTSERLSELSWQALSQLFDQHPIHPELTQNILTDLLAFQASAAQRPWTTGMTDRSLFFLPDMIRAVKRGQVGLLKMVSGKSGAGGPLNHLYTLLLEHLSPHVRESEKDLLRKLPVTGTTFKGLLIHLIIRFTEQLPTSYPSSIQPFLEQQHLTIGLLAAELFGWDLRPQRIALTADKLMVAATTFCEENQLTLPPWEAFIMSLGFEQNKWQHILKEQQLVEGYLDNINKMNIQAPISYGWVLIKVPSLEKVRWQAINEDQVLLESRQQVLDQLEPFSSRIIPKTEVVREAAGFRQLSYYSIKTEGSYAHTARGPLIKQLWQRADSLVQGVAIHVNWTLGALNCPQDSSTLASPKEALIHYRRLAPLFRKDHEFCLVNDLLKINGSGLAALYVNKRAAAHDRRDLYLGFDPRHGDITLLLHLSSDNLSRRERAHYAHDAKLTVGVGPEGHLPSMISHQPQLGILRVEGSGLRLHSHYSISSESAPFYLHDDASAISITISPPRDRQIGFMIRSDDPNMLQLQTWSPNRSQLLSTLPPIPYADRDSEHLQQALQSLLPYQITTLYLPNKKHLQLMLDQQQISGLLALAAEQVEVFSAKGQDVGQSGINMTSAVVSFTVTLLGHLHIIHRESYLFVGGEKSDNATLIRYSTPLSVSGLTPYQYQLELDHLQPVLDSLSRPNPQERCFSASGVDYRWVTAAEKATALKISGILNGQQSQLLLEQNRSTVSHLEGSSRRILLVDHYTAQAELDSQLILQQVTECGRATQLPGGQGRNFSLLGMAYLNGECDTLQFESPQGDVITHRFPAQTTLHLNGIRYQVQDNQLYAIGVPNEMISDEQLIHYQTPMQRVSVRLASASFKNERSLDDNDTLTTHQLALATHPEREEDFRLKALKARVPHPRQRRDLPSAEPLASGAVQNKPRGSALIEGFVTLLGGVHWEWPALFSAWRSQASLGSEPPVLESTTGQAKPQSSIRAGEYTSNHFQGLLQLLDLMIRSWIGRPHQRLPSPLIDPLAEAEARVLAIKLVDRALEKKSPLAGTGTMQAATAIQPLDSLALQQQVAQKLYAGQLQAIGKLVDLTAEEVLEVMDGSVTTQQCQRSMAYSHYQAINYLQQQCAALPTPHDQSGRSHRTIVSTRHHLPHCLPTSSG